MILIDVEIHTLYVSGKGVGLGLGVGGGGKAIA